MDSIENLLSVTEFAKLRKISRKTVLKAISDGLIEPALLGARKLPYIDAYKYRDFVPRRLRKKKKEVDTKSPTPPAAKTWDQFESDELAKAKSNHFGLPVGIFNEAIERIATMIENNNGHEYDIPIPIPEVDDESELAIQRAAYILPRPIEELVNSALDYIEKTYKKPWMLPEFIAFCNIMLIDIISGNKGNAD
jgi:hypothetical protein